MDAVTLARLQFGITTVYHFFFVPLTLGLSIVVALLQTQAYRTGKPEYRALARFWGRLFLINFAIGLATGIVQEFQFGMNWSEYSRFVGDIFGAPLAIEALVAFFMESTFLGIWIFGEGKVSPKIHLFSIWMVAFGSNLSAIWILIANSFMHNPVGYTLANGRAEMTDFFALITNKHVLLQYPHILSGSLITAGFFLVAISAWHLARKNSQHPHYMAFHKSLILGASISLIGTVLSLGTGHAQAQVIPQWQPMKLAAMEGLYETKNPAGLSLFSLLDEKEHRETFSVRIPYALSFLVHNKPTGEVQGMNDIQREYEAKYGSERDYRPPVFIAYWTFRIMVGIGVLLMLLSAVLLLLRKKNLPPWFLALLSWTVILPYLGNATGWILAEMGRQPWVVQGIITLQQAVSPSVDTGSLWFSLLTFTGLYAVLCFIAVKLFIKHSQAGLSETDFSPQPHSH